MIKSHSTTKSFKKKHIINKQPKQKIFPVRQFPNPKVIDYKIETNTNEVQTNVIKGEQDNQFTKPLSYIFLSRLPKIIPSFNQSVLRAFLLQQDGETCSKIRFIFLL